MMLWSCYEKNLGKISPKMITIKAQKSSRQSAESPLFKPKSAVKEYKKAVSLTIWRPLLYQLSYTPKYSLVVSVIARDHARVVALLFVRELVYHRTCEKSRLFCKVCRFCRMILHACERRAPNKEKTMFNPSYLRASPVFQTHFDNFSPCGCSAAERVRN